MTQQPETTFPPDADTESSAPAWGVLEWVALSQTLLPAVLLLPGTQSLRLFIRIAAYGVSLAALVLLWHRRRESHPSNSTLVLIAVYLSIMLCHPTTNTVLAGLAQTMLYISVFAPIFWAPALIGKSKHLERILWIILVANGLNSFVGVMQVHDPGRWMPAEFSVEAMESTYGLAAVSYTGPNGKLIIRPPGLFDTPGAVSGAGMTAATLGFIMLTRKGSLFAKLFSFTFSILGISAILLSQVRTAVLITAGAIVVYLMILLVRREFSQFVATIFGCAGGVIGAVFLSLSLGGEAVAERFTTLVEKDPMSVYYESKRGEQMEHAIADMARKYPLGAGLARWGMMRKYFGDEMNMTSPLIWSELQLPSWILDGGLPLVLLYGFALLVTTYDQMNWTLYSKTQAAQQWGPVVIALSAGTIALIFGFTPFTTQVGLQYWFICGCFYGACLHEEEIA